MSSTDSETGSSSYPLKVRSHIYMLPIGQVIRNHGLTSHFYADDTVLYVSASPTSDGVTMCTSSLIERCCTDIKRWMNSNYMKLNTNKTELLVIGTPGHLNKVPAFNLNIGDDCVEVSKQIKNLGVVFDRNMKMQTHIREVARNAMYHLHNIIYLLSASDVAATKVCYLTQEPDPDEGNRLRWIQPFEDMCSCTSIRPGGLFKVAPNRKTKPSYTDEPIFTDDQEDIHDHYGCHMKDCQDLLDAGRKEDGIYTIHPIQNDNGIQVFCDMTKHTGWIVFQRRVNGSVNFDRSWAEYKKGFGSMDGEFWLGNEILHNLTDAEGNWAIRLDLTNEENKTGHLLKKQFRVGPDDYTLFLENSEIPPTVGRYCGHKLGMEDGSIPDDRITASSQWDKRFPPSNARLNLNGFWGPAENQLDHSWLQIFTGSEPVQIEGVITQGYPYDYYWVTQYQVQYSNDSTAWLYVNGDSTPQTFVGNTDRNTPVTNIFQQPIQARYIRIRPTAWIGWPDLRIELIGCRAHKVCQQKLGMGDGTIPDESITTSSTDDWSCSRNPFGRLDVRGGWCPTLNDIYSAWFQVDLKHPVLIQGVVIQGNNHNENWVKEFIVSYGDNEKDQRFIGGTDEDNAQRFPGNTDWYTRVTNMFIEEIRARYIRITPTGYYQRPGMRIELLGCNERLFCLDRLGMGDGSIPDYRITASSTQQREDGTCQPSKSRLTQSTNSQTIGWCPDHNDNNPWLQIDLGSKVIVEGIMMLQISDQGTSEDVSHGYRLEYSDDQSTWHTMGSAQIIRRNTAADSVATSMFNPPITARYIRISLNQTDGSLWIRVELLGCKVRWVCRQRLLKQAHIIPDESPRLQIDLLLLTLVEGVIAQGKNETSFQVEYSLDNVTWVYVSHQVAPEGKPQTFHGNTLQSAPLTNVFKQPIRARFIRVTQTDVGHPAVSIELVGCRNDILETANNQAFSIHHHTDNNQNDTNCPGLNSEGGWWFNRCSGIPGVDNNLNAEYIQPGDTMGPYKRVIRATEWNGSRIVKTEIKIRRQSPPRG
ncbi:uncharacterized protein [Asterias amurensis]|uniref:uncharacterized protein n=1 Tax=Asterias amurensis TaxID=7602 RepID=UPI003AB380B4